MIGLLKSRKAILGLFSLVFYVALIAFPDTRPVIGEVGGVLFALLSITVLGITFEDSVKLWAARPVSMADAVAALAEEIVRLLEAENEEPGEEGGEGEAQG